ncbi:MAG: HEAT repeat domain-containing protein [Acidobacteria bacterium]|nr:MAG: HEAT repeat domain-containing protein [Acidobacteriota bacterium]
MTMNGVPQSLDTSWEECIALLDSLPSLSVEARVAALEKLIRNPSPGIRSRALRMGAAVLPDEQLKSYLRSEADDVLRNAGVEMLKMRGNRGFSLALQLLKDDDSDIVLQAVVVLTALRDPRALEPLRGVLHHQDPNVVQEAIVAIGQLGDARAIPDLLGFLEADPWLQMAAVQALGNLRSPVAVPHLKRLLTDLMAGPLAAEALARIGGQSAFLALVHHWLRFRNELDTETVLGLLAHVLEGLPRAPKEVPDFRAALLDLLEDDRETIRVTAARCLLTLGASAEDRKALVLVADFHQEASVLPACLHHRSDLIGYLIAQTGSQRTWGFLLAARFPDETPIPTLADALASTPLPDQFGPLLRALEKIRHPDLAEPLLGFYLRQPEEQRPLLHPLLRIHRASLAAHLEDAGLEDATRVVLKALLGVPENELVAEITALPHEERVRAMAELVGQDRLMRLLPWDAWLREAPESYGPVAAEFASKVGLRELAASFRQLLEKRPEPYLIRTLGELGDRKSVKLLIGLLEETSSPLEPIVIESLGRIGGPQARQALRGATRSHRAQRQRMAFRALARCATEEDDAIFRDAISNQDWYIRLSCAEVLGRFSRPENLAALAQLAADPVPIVAQRALSFLES